MKEVKTDDGSITFHNDDYDETYHSTTGAIEEAREKFVNACDIQRLTKTGSVSILDVCFGLGYNSACAIEMIKRINPNCRINMVALENDPQILEKIQSIEPDIQYYDIIKTLSKNLVYENALISSKILLGDALVKIDEIQGIYFDAVFFDPFSPKKCPQLWAEDFFRKIFSLMSKGSVLATYSCAGQVRRNLKAAGFRVEDGPRVGRRSPSTIAYKD